jgi:phosphopantetheine--protein transferase-like protein
MDGNPRVDAAIAYLSRLTGQNISADQPIGLRSIHRVALASWARKEQLQVRGSLMNSSAPFSIRELLAAEADAAPGPSDGHATPSQEAPPLEGTTWGGIGLDIEDVASLPEAEDYREHFFYRDNFSPAEIAHCLLQANVRASFCGIWAAKEAILKSHMRPAKSTRLIDIQITYEEGGRPTHPNCYVSISHTAHTAVAVCLPKPAPAFAGTVASMPTYLREVPQPASASASPSPRQSRKIIAALFIMAIICAILFAILFFKRHY